MQDENSKKLPSRSETPDRKQHSPRPWLYVGFGCLMLVAGASVYYTAPDGAEDPGLIIAAGIIFALNGLSILRHHHSSVQSWLGYAFGAILLVHITHPSKLRDLADLFLLTEPIASGFFYAAIVAVILVAILTIRASLRPADTSESRRSEDVDGR